MQIHKWPREQKQKLIENVQHYFDAERGEQIGALQAELLLEFIANELKPLIYNEAIQDALKLIGEKMVTLEDDLHALKKHTQ